MSIDFPTDSISLRVLPSVDGFQLTAYEVPDNDSRPDDEGYSEDDRKSWSRDEWHFVGVTVIASRDGIPLGEASIWGLDTGGPRSDVLADAPGFTVCTPDPVTGEIGPAVTETTFAHGYGSDLVHSALARAREQLLRLID